MEIVYFDEVDESEMTELMLACFNHAYSKEHVDNMIESDRRMPEWGGELYAVEDDKVLGCVGLLYPKARLSGEVKKVGGIRNVCSRPSESRRGAIKKLMERAHEILCEKVNFSFLMTSKAGVAYNLYKKLGYRTVHVPPRAYKRVEGRDTDIEFREEKDPEFIRSSYLDSVEDLSGLVIREKDYFEMAEARGWPDNDDLKIAYLDGERIGYVMCESSRNSLLVKEFAAERGHRKDFLKALESLSDKDYVVISYVNPSYKQILHEEDHSWYDDLWYRVMCKDLDADEPLKKEEKRRFHVGAYEVY